MQLHVFITSFGTVECGGHIASRNAKKKVFIILFKRRSHLLLQLQRNTMAIFEIRGDVCSRGNDTCGCAFWLAWHAKLHTLFVWLVVEHTIVL